MDEKKSKEIEALTADHERWDNRELGASEVHMRVLSEEEEREIDDGLGLQHISIRLNKGLIEQLKKLALLEAIGYQPLIRQVLMRYVRENEAKLDILLSEQETADKAEKLFAEVLRLRSEIPKLEQMSNERVIAECNYSKYLGQARTLFLDTLECNDEVLKQHAKLRIKQIADLCQEELHAFHDKKYPKKKRAVS